MAKKKDVEPVVEEEAAPKPKAAKEPTVREGHVHAEVKDGVAVLAFGEIVPGEEEATFKAASYHALTRDDALNLAADLPSTVQEAAAAAAHTG